MKKSFFIMRHGETVANLEGYAAGSLDTPLTEKGKAQAISSEERVYDSRGKINYIVYSSLSRARDTAGFINARLDRAMFQTGLLAEQCFGDWRGMKWGEMRALLDQGINPPNGESLEEFYNRALKGIEWALDVSEGTPLIVAHGGTFDALFDYLKLENIDVENCALYEFSHQEKRFSPVVEEKIAKSI